MSRLFFFFFFFLQLSQLRCSHSLSIAAPLAPCPCPRTTFAARFSSSALVVRARLLSITILPTPPPPPCLTQVPRCLLPQILYQTVLYKLRISTVFKGCPPASDPFLFVTDFARHSRGTDPCRFPLRKGVTYMLNLQQPIVNPLRKDLRSYSLIGKCQGHRRWRALKPRQRRFLRRAAKLAKNKCLPL